MVVSVQFLVHTHYSQKQRRRRNADGVMSYETQTLCTVDIGSPVH